MVYSQGTGEYAPSWLALEQALGGRMILKGSIEEIRAQYDGLIAVLIPLLPKPSENVVSEEGEVDGVKYRLYWPKGTKGELPTGVWTHGGGFVTGDLNADDVLCRVVSEHTQSAIVNIDYRLAPEHKWPTQLEDCMKVYRWAHKNAASFHGSPEKFYTIGGSAGGALALEIALQVVRDPALKASLKGIVAMVPLAVHPAHVPEPYREMYTANQDNAVGTPVIDGESMAIFGSALGAEPTDEEAFVILATKDHKSFPPTYITTCEFDPLRDDGFVLEKVLTEAGVPVKHDHYPGMPHYFWIMPQVPEGQEYVGKLLGGVEWVKGQM
ncbi:hypothetical protein LTR53_008393 [Teratosphaeriaceae sp. CCFEE 6253]|nr:hypothetical protein LTR53_008393 [Teratosphaeriaceae sp. CCFEE 6253]